MPYYQAGDYYQGDYYQAGGLFSGLGKIVKKVAGTALSVLPGGGIVKAGLKVGSAIASGLSSRAAPQIDFSPDVNIQAFRGLGMLPTFGGPGGMLQKRRRMNPLNIKALRRAMRRAKGFERQARRVGTFFSPGKTFRLKGRRRRAK